MKKFCENVKLLIDNYNAIYEQVQKETFVLISDNKIVSVFDASLCTYEQAFATALQQFNYGEFLLVAVDGSSEQFKQYKLSYDTFILPRILKEKTK